MEHIDEDRVRIRAYEIWQAEGCPDGRDVQHWQQAMAETTAKDAYGIGPWELARMRKPKLGAR